MRNFNDESYILIVYILDVGNNRLINGGKYPLYKLVLLLDVAVSVIPTCLIYLQYDLVLPCPKQGLSVCPPL